MIRSALCCAALLAFGASARAGELDKEATPAKVGVSAPQVSGSEMDKESPTDAWRHRGGWGGYYGGYGGYYGGYRPYGFYGGYRPYGFYGGYNPYAYRPYFSPFVGYRSFSYGGFGGFGGGFGYASYSYYGW